jgi:aryl-alcohol dehydrogenase-like predicted oxidoreductase
LASRWERKMPSISWTSPQKVHFIYIIGGEIYLTTSAPAPALSHLASLLVSFFSLLVSFFSLSLSLSLSHVIIQTEFGLNFIDSAESWPAPSGPSSAGDSESIIGAYLTKKGNDRSKVVISTKVCCFSDELTCVRNGGQGTRASRGQIEEAVDAQLARLNTDYIDLLQLHWPERYTPLFGAPEYDYALERRSEDVASFQDICETMHALVQSGKIRAWGLSNETPYGVTSFVRTAEALGLTKPTVTQNAYNLLVRNDFESGMQETCAPINCDVGLLAYSPLAGGALTGKYMDAADPGLEHARLHKYVGFMHRYIAPPAVEAVRRYMEVARSFELPLEVVSLAWVYSRPFVTSTLIGATTTNQLRNNIKALNLPMNEEMTRMLNAAYAKGMDPTRGVFEIRDPYREYVDPSKLPWGAKDQDVDPELDILINQRLSKL